MQIRIRHIRNKYELNKRTFGRIRIRIIAGAFIWVYLFYLCVTLCASHLGSCNFCLYLFGELLSEAKDAAGAEQLLSSVAKIVCFIMH